MRNLLVIILIFSLMGSCKRPQPHSSPENPNIVSESNYSDNRIERSHNSNSRGENTIRMNKKGGVYEIPIKINGIAMDFIFDTGASNISISETEAYFLLKQGKLLEKDFIGSMQFMDATGGISEGTIINLRTVEIGNRLIKNVKASVVHNMEAPLLLGQSALARFGKVTIDYNNNILSFE